jgi:hypothetical protein
MNNEITIHNIQDVFFLMEEEENLFSLQMRDGVYYWDIVRRQIFLSLHTMHGGPFAEEDALPAPTLQSNVKDLLRLVLNWITRQYLVFKAPKYIFITGQRIRRGFDLVDNISDHLYNLVFEDAVAIELMNKAAISYRNMLFGCKTRLPPVAVRRSRDDEELLQVATMIGAVVHKHFGISIDVRRLIEEPILTFIENRNYYRKLFSKFRPKIIVCSNNGTLYGMFFAAKEMQVPTIELQHGASSSRTISWSYPKSITASHPGLSLPTAYLTYSDFWNRNTHYPVSYSNSIGNDHFFQEPIEGDDNGVLIVSSYMYRESLLNLAVKLTNLVDGNKIYFKLHPHEYNQKDAVVSACGGKENIIVVCDEMEFPELFKLCNYVVGVHSTILYIALQAGKKVCIFKQSNYFWHDDIFDYVELFDNANELNNILRSPHGMYFNNMSDTPELFQPFDVQRFMQVLDDVQLFNKYGSVPLLPHAVQ